MKKVNFAARLSALCAIFILICAVYLVVLVNLQITGQDYYTIVEEEASTRYVKIAAKRGEIYDRNGKALVINTTNYEIELEYGAMPKANADFNKVILDVRKAIIDGGGESCLTVPVFPYKGEYPSYTRDEEFFESATNRIKFAALIKRLELDEDTTDEELLEFLFKRYGLKKYDSSIGEYADVYEKDEAEIIMRTRFEMEYIQFSRVEPYTMANNVSIQTLTYVKELSFGQVMITESPARTYIYDGYASHILGHIGQIPAEKLEEYLEKDYSGDAYVGRSGAEQVFEDYLRGTDGTMEIVEDAYGNIISKTIVKEPIPGKDVYLTIDMDLQMSTEDALRDNIEIIHERAASTKGSQDGEDAAKAAAVAIDPNTGETLAIASYPTFNLSDYIKNYTAYAEDELQPLYNRALLGTYTPGSTFKPGVAAAALEEGIITVNTTIVDRGVYTYYQKNGVGYAPRCWIYLQKGRTHGAQNVVQAIQNSCNYFFYDVGRRLGIEQINEYSKKFGLGSATGIELSESLGTLAGPEHSQKTGVPWVDGNTLQAAIGQSDNTFTPIQLSVYTSALINGGVRYRATLLHEVREYASGEIIYESTPEIVAKIEFKEDILPTIKTAMKDVVESGSAARIFRNYDIAVGGKTGTAQVGKNKSDNALFIGFAPYAEPKIAVTVVIEQGANGTDAAYTARAMYDCYLKGEKYEKQYEDFEIVP